MSSGIRLNRNLVNEYIKWLSYEPEFEKKEKEKFYSKDVKDLSEEELKKLSEYKKRDELLVLFKKYKKNECTEEEFLKVNGYGSKLLERLMCDKFTKEELEIAEEKMDNFDIDLCKDLEFKYKKGEYDNLPMIDQYIIYMVLKKYHNISILRTNKLIRDSIEENHKKYVKGLEFTNRKNG